MADKKCLVCGDSEYAGTRWPVDLGGTGSYARPWVERCDTCELYASDLEAAVYIASMENAEVGLARIAPDSDHWQPYIQSPGSGPGDLPENVRQHRERVLPVAARLITEARGRLRQAASIMRNAESGFPVGDKWAGSVANDLDRICFDENGGQPDLEDALLAIETMEEECATD